MPNSGAIVNPRVLVIDDNPAIHKDFKKVLGAGLGEAADLQADEVVLFGAASSTPARPTFEVDSALQGQEGVERVREALRAGRPYAMAIVDMQMPPGWDGLETIERLWKVDPDVQVVICSAHAGYDWTELVVRLGHADKLLVVKKPFEPIEVLQCANALTRKWQNEWIVRRQVETLEKVVTDRTEGLETANAQLRYLATHDALTGLPNRALLEDRIGQAITLAQRSRAPFALMLLDLDRFKSVNDSMGHRAGDELLMEVAQKLRSVVRGVDTVARLGGDEFVLILQSVTGRDECLRVAERALAALAPTIRIQGVDLRATCSVGIALYPEDGDSMALLLNHADVAMYSAKQRGRNNIQCFAAGMSVGAQEKVKLERELESALLLGQFVLHYQPKVDMASGEIASAEALVRWRHPDRGLLAPGEFIPVAEECGLIGAIGDWVVHEACRQARSWQDAGLPALRIAVNLSPAQFRHSDLLATIRRALDAARLDARFLEVELTESAVMSEPETSVTILEQLSQMGVVVSVDDFGTGHSSLSYLRRLPVDTLKIDREFIREIMSHPDDASIVRAIVLLAHSLRLKVVAEGVEAVEQLEFLKTLGCDEYQGYYFSPAVPADDFVALLERSADRNRALMDDVAMRTPRKLAA
jgi:diguanylate cyclase (GGDEF)-like protein